MILSSMERHSAKDQVCKVIQFTILPAPSYFAFFNVLYIWASGPSLFMESTDSMIDDKCDPRL